MPRACQTCLAGHCLSMPIWKALKVFGPAWTELVVVFGVGVQVGYDVHACIVPC